MFRVRRNPCRQTPAREIGAVLEVVEEAEEVVLHGLAVLEDGLALGLLSGEHERDDLVQVRNLCESSHCVAPFGTRKRPAAEFASMRQAGDYFNVVRVRYGVKSVSRNCLQGVSDMAAGSRSPAGPAAPRLTNASRMDVFPGCIPKRGTRFAREG